ncbi:MAG TPA: coproporphyrinogen dehydrogenase HemZ [Clostridiales bacterium]|nr:coproporphyrinogen dehydrogenase HemZ [Clostridiales bacterium]
MKIILEGHDNYYGLSDVVRLFYGPCKEDREKGMLICEDAPDMEIISSVKDGCVKTFVKGHPGTASDLCPIPVKREVKRSLYILLSDLTGRSFPWGCLTGIRPTVVAREESFSPSSMSSSYLVREDKADLACRTAIAEDKVLESLPEDRLNIYIGIPFCPTRCRYCSFISSDAGKHLGLLPDYEKALEKEFSLLAPLLSKTPSTIYIGGGTPTVFDDRTFARLLEFLASRVDMKEVAEFTVEAGRPDTITEYKADAMADTGVRRVCINPQTMNDDTLKRLGRAHSVEDVYKAYKIVRKSGIEVVNTDLIAGLPGEGAEQFLDSLDKVLGLSPENITIHTLYKKRRAEMKREDVLGDSEDNCIDRAVKEAYRILGDNSYSPYYLYRQKDTGHGLENTGFSKEGEQCLYNVAMMSDRRNVLSVGAGAVSKRVFDGGRFERHGCVKDPIMYMSSCEEQAAAKLDFFLGKQ